MTLRDALLKQFDVESPFTRRTLERVPLDKSAWKPHEKSMTLGWLATFLAVMWSWGNHVLEEEVFDATAASSKPDLPKTSADLVAMYDQSTAAFRTSLAKVDDTRLAGSWTLRMNGKTLFTQSRWLVLQTFIFNHAVHHRAQLGVYLRLNGIAVPAIYNSSADEQGGMFIA